MHAFHRCDKYFLSTLVDSSRDVDGMDDQTVYTSTRPYPPFSTKCSTFIFLIPKGNSLVKRRKLKSQTIRFLSLSPRSLADIVSRSFLLVSNVQSETKGVSLPSR